MWHIIAWYAVYTHVYVCLCVGVRACTHMCVQGGMYSACMHLFVQCSILVVCASKVALCDQEQYYLNNHYLTATHDSMTVSIISYIL